MFRLHVNTRATLLFLSMCKRRRARRAGNGIATGDSVATRPWDKVRRTRDISCTPVRRKYGWRDDFQWTDMTRHPIPTYRRLLEYCTSRRLA